jgi:hypothetical protein
MSAHVQQKEMIELFKFLLIFKYKTTLDLLVIISEFWVKFEKLNDICLI